MTVWADRVSWPKIRALASGGAYALLPVGSTEAHGPHLPLGVDVVIAEEVCRRLGERLMKKQRETVIFPAVNYGLTDFAASFSGTVTLSAQVAQSMMEEVLRGIAGHGFSNIALINHHLEPAHFAVVHQAAKSAAEKSGARIVVPDHRKRPHNEKLGEEFIHGGSHAGCYETSLVMAAAPHLVDEAERQKLPTLAVNLPAMIKGGARNFEECGGPDAYFGAPAEATAQEGHRLFDVLTDIAEAAL